MNIICKNLIGIKNLKLKKILNKMGIDKTKEGEFEYEK